MKTAETKHTPTPWATDIEVETFDGTVLDATIYINYGTGKGGEICTFRHDPDNGLDNRDPEQVANANFIVRACNEHAALVAVAEWAQKIVDGRADYEDLIPSLNNLAAVRKLSPGVPS